MTSKPTPFLLTVREVASILRIHRPKVYVLIKENIIDGFKVGSDWRVKKDSVEKLIGPIPQTFFAQDHRLENLDSVDDAA
jgi:excisionase family DNA binding protein